MATRTVTIHDRCTTPGCGKTLHFVSEAERGMCGVCWMKVMPADQKKALNRLVASAFNGASDAEKAAAVKDALAKLKRDEDAK